jgi:anti-anti-sigma factor
MKNKTFLIKNLTGKDPKVQTLTFEGDLGIKNAEEIKKTIQTMKFSADLVSLQLKNVEKLDITTIQTIIALKNSLKTRGKDVSLTSALPQEIERLLSNTGFEKIL